MSSNDGHKTADVTHDHNAPLMLRLPCANTVASSHTTKDDNVTGSCIWLYRAVRKGALLSRCRVY